MKTYPHRPITKEERADWDASDGLCPSTVVRDDGAPWPYFCTRDSVHEMPHRALGAVEVHAEWEDEDQL